MTPPQHKPVTPYEHPVSRYCMQPILFLVDLQVTHKYQTKRFKQWLLIVEECDSQVAVGHIF